MNTKISKGPNGWKAQTEISLGMVAKGERLLHITTSKAGPGRGISTIASVCVQSDGFQTCVLGFGSPCGDYWQTVLRMGGACTERAVAKLHAEALLQVGTIEAAARAHYVSKDAPQVGRGQEGME